ncbi:MAG: hypothetical protein SGBAC_006456 [Bacillariaceae sp.]
MVEKKKKEKKEKTSSAEEFTVGYFEEILEEVKGKCEKKIKIKTKDKEAFQTACDSAYQNWTNKVENEKYLDELMENKGASKDEIAEAQKFAEESSKAQPKYEKHATRQALKIFEGLDGDKMSDIEDKLVKGAIIAQATPNALAKFAADGYKNQNLLKRLFNDPELMKEMLRNGGAAQYEYAEAMRIYVECLGDDYDEEEDQDKFFPINKKIALACALELCTGVRHFDTADTIDPVARYKHFEEAHRNGELDPAFPHFSVWELRQVVNCDAPNDQMEWCRNMVMLYCPHVTCITDPKMTYTYLLQTDVRQRPPKWTGSPRTYPMVLSGGGNESVNSWFGRFVLQSFGLPVWGSKFRRKEGFTRWTSAGWEAMNGADWETGMWNGKAGKDFKMELEARNKAPEVEYFKKLVYLQCLADVIDPGDTMAIPKEERDVLHPERFWRSMSIVSLELLFQTQAEKERTFERTGESLVETKVEKYLKMYEDDVPDKDPKIDDSGKITIYASKHNGVAEGNVLTMASFKGGQQLNLIADGQVEYEVPDEAPTKKYKVVLEVNTVSSNKTPLTIYNVADDDNRITITLPYTMGMWKKTDPVELELKGGDTIRFSRPKNALGVALKKVILS